jgi:ABC-type Fe3+-hydroxamate transport system substrate-binding protein
MASGRVAVDDLGVEVDVPRPVQRVVSLVPSLTESIAETRPGALVGATDWCTFPADLEVTRIRGTKNPDTSAVIALRPDLVIANEEENRELDVRRLRAAGIAVWVTRIRSVDEALASIERMFVDGLGWDVPDWLGAAARTWIAPAPPDGPRVAVVIWRDPWMVVGGRTFTGDLVSRLGCVHAFAGHADRYPTVGVDDLDAMGLDLVLLPDEPYAFSPTDGPEAFTRTPTRLVSGRLLTWYGPSLVTAREALAGSILSR